MVETPNKVDLVQTVVACELKESCYRVSYVEYYYEAVYHADGVKEERLKVSISPITGQTFNSMHRLDISFTTLVSQPLL